MLCYVLYNVYLYCFVCFRSALKVEDKKLFVRDNVYDLDHNIHIFAFGKAVLGMCRAAEEILKPHICGGVASIPSGLKQSLRNNNLRY